MKLGNNIKLLKQKCTRATPNYRSPANTRNVKAMKPFPHWIPVAPSECSLKPSSQKTLILKHKTKKTVNVKPFKLQQHEKYNPFPKLPPQMISPLPIRSLVSP